MRVPTARPAGGAARRAPPSQQHTGAVVPIWGQGPGAAAVLGTTDHTDLFDLITGGPRTPLEGASAAGQAHGWAGPCAGGC